MLDDERQSGEPAHTNRLEYRAGMEDQKMFHPSTVILVAFCVMLFLIAMVFVLILFAVSMDYKGWDRPAGKAGQIIALSAGATILGLLMFHAVRCQRRIEKRARATGIWIGIALAALIEGVCFVANTR